MIKKFSLIPVLSVFALLVLQPVYADAPATQTQSSQDVIEDIKTNDKPQADAAPADTKSSSETALSADAKSPVDVASEPKAAEEPSASPKLDEQIKTETPDVSAKEKRDLIAQSEWDAYPIHAGDKIKIIVHGEKELSDSYTVDAKGDIHFPLIEKIHAEGVSLNNFRENLRAALAKDYLNNPQVEMTFEESIFNSVSILGQVNRPGNYILPPKMTFLRMISIAGGFSVTANYETCKVVRTAPDGTKSSLDIDVEGMLNGKVADAELKPGDVVFVPKTASTFDEKEEYINSVAVLGEVQKPGNYKITSGMTLVRVLSQAGGLARGADSGQATLTRKDASGKLKIVTVNIKSIVDGAAPDMMLEAGDILYVPSTRGTNMDIVDLSHSVSVLGQVQKPSNYDFIPGMTLVQLISEAGGFTPVANSSQVRITRRTADGGKKILEYSVSAILDGRSSDVKLEIGDIVYVPESVF